MAASPSRYQVLLFSNRDTRLAFSAAAAATCRDVSVRASATDAMTY